MTGSQCPSPSFTSLPVHIQLIVDYLSDGLSVCCRSWQSTVDLIMEGRQFVHHPVHHRVSAWRTKGENVTVFKGLEAHMANILDALKQKSFMSW